MDTIGIRVDEETIDEIDAIVDQSHGMTRSTVARRALDQGLSDDLVVDIYEDLEYITAEVADQIDEPGRSLQDRRALAESLNDVIRYLHSRHEEEEPAKKSDITADTGVTDDQWVSSVGTALRDLGDIEDSPVGRDGRQYLASG